MSPPPLFVSFDPFERIYSNSFQLDLEGLVLHCFWVLNACLCFLFEEKQEIEVALDFVWQEFGRILADIFEFALVLE